MRYIVLAILLASCASGSKETIKAEYEAVVLQKSKTDNLLLATKNMHESMKAINTDSANLYWTNFIDSLRKESVDLEKRKEALASKLY